jgi:two-component system, OmpR family, sensor histidine kinase KdpD
MATNGNSHRPGWTAFALKLSLASLLIAALTAAGVAIRANAATIGFAYLIAILFVALWGGLTTSLVSSIVATACYNFFFLPPVGTFTIQDPANWFALASFFIASLVVSRLLVDARTQTAHAKEREAEIEALYALSIDLFAATSRVGAVGEATARVLRSVEATGGGLLLFAGSPHAQQVVSWSGPKEDEIEDLAAGVGRHGQTLEFPGRNGRELYVALKVGGRIAGVLVVRGTRATVRAVESVAALLALAVERERFVAEGVHLQALRESDALKTSILRAVSHDLNTPLVTIALQIERLRDRVPPQSADRAVLETIAAEADRLRRRIGNLLTMARLELGTAVPRPEPTPPADLFHAAREHLALIAERRPIDVVIGADCPDVFVDPVLAVEILVNLIENADRISPPGGHILLTAHQHPADPEKVRMEVVDEGPGIARASEPSRRFLAEAEEASDTSRRGLGLEIARSLAAANHGEVTLLNRPEGGAIARIDLPAAHRRALVESLS